MTLQENRKFETKKIISNLQKLCLRGFEMNLFFIYEMGIANLLRQKKILFQM